MLDPSHTVSPQTHSSLLSATISLHCHSQNYDSELRLMRKPNVPCHRNQPKATYTRDHRSSLDSRPFLRNLSSAQHSPNQIWKLIIQPKKDVDLKVTVAVFLRGQLVQLAKPDLRLTNVETHVEHPHTSRFTQEEL